MTTRIIKTTQMALIVAIVIGGLLCAFMRGLSKVHVTLLWFAAAQGWTPAVNVLATLGADPNAANPNGDSALMFASGYRGNAECVAALIRHGANVNRRDQLGNTALTSAATCGTLATVQTLILSHADINTLNSRGITPLMTAAYHGREPQVACLLNAGAKVNVIDKAGNTALTLAKPYPNIVALLKRDGAISSPSPP